MSDEATSEAQPAPLDPSNAVPSPHSMKATSSTHSNAAASVGLDSLLGISSLFVKQELEPIEIFLGFETNNRYSVYNNEGYRIYYLGEDTNYCWRCCCTSDRPFIVRVYDPNGRQVMDIQREFNAMICLFGGGTAGNNVTIKSSITGEIFGQVTQVMDCHIPRFQVLAPTGQPVLYIKGPCCFCYDVEFQVFDNQSEELIGTIKRWFTGALFSDADNFGMSFPPNLNIRTKAALLGAIITIDFSYFETSGGGGGYGYGYGRRGGGGSRGCGWIYIVGILIALIAIIVALSYLIPEIESWQTTTTPDYGYGR